MGSLASLDIDHSNGRTACLSLRHNQLLGLSERKHLKGLWDLLTMSWAVQIVISWSPNARDFCYSTAVVWNNWNNVRKNGIEPSIPSTVSAVFDFLTRPALWRFTSPIKLTSCVSIVSHVSAHIMLKRQKCHALSHSLTLDPLRSNEENDVQDKTREFACNQSA